MPTDLPPPKPETPRVRRRPGLPLYVTLPALSVVIVYELLRPVIGHGATDWVVVAVGGAGMAIALIARLSAKV